MSSVAVAAERYIRLAAKNPELEFEKFLQKKSRVDASVLIAVDFEFCEYWRDDKPGVALTAIYFVQDASQLSIGVLPTAQFNLCEKAWCERSSGPDALVVALPVSLFPLKGAIPLRPISIPKPWGQEIWYTGIEKRGVVEVGVEGRSVPLPWLLAIAPQRLTSGIEQPILLKILDPLAEPVFGDLYFELHRQKQEVYVVTAVDHDAWRDGVGAIRFGFDESKRKEYSEDEVFLREYLAAVRDYRIVRKQIDKEIDLLRTRDGIELNAPVSAETLADWLEEVEPGLRTSETELRTRMESFTGLLPLRVGDVVKVPCFVPHSLQHGVRTVEFQTPVYERLILSFAQKVLTQTDWDTDEAAGVLQLDPEPAAPFPLMASGEGWKEEQIVQFDDFEVRRITLQSGARLQLKHGRGYGLGMVVGRALDLEKDRFLPDDAILLPAGFEPAALCNNSDSQAYFLLALPLQ